MGAVMTINKHPRNPTALIRFTCDLISSVNKKRLLDPQMVLGGQLKLGDILQNITNNNGRYIEFAGVYLQHQSSGSVLMRATYKNADKSGLQSKSFSLKKYGIKGAFLKAVKQRGLYCDFKGTIPVDDLYIPTAKDLLQFSILVKGSSWAKENNIEALYKHAELNNGVQV